VNLAVCGKLPKNGYHYHRIVQGFQRIFGATIFFGTEEQRQKAAGLDAARFHFLDRTHIWYNREATVNPNGDESNHTIALSDAFHNEIDRHKIPIERRVVAALANAPSVLASMMKDQRLLPQGIEACGGVTLVFGLSGRKDWLDSTIAT
jgi:hypothetical protein